MNNKMIKKMIATLTVAVMTFGFVGCGNTDNESVATSTSEKEKVEESQTVENTVESVEETGVTFPLEEEVTFDLMVRYDGDANEAMNAVPFWQELYEMTNVKINLIALPSESVMTNLNALFTAGKAGDAIVDNIISEADVISFASSGLIIPIEEYIEDPEIMPNFNEIVLAESPKSKGYITAADGHIYALPRYNANSGDYLESPLWINKAWLDAVGMGVPTSVEELEAAMIAFRDNDVNGNGDKNDEIPLLFVNNDSMSHMEGLLGIWGIATKDSANDHYFDIDDGKAIYVPTSDAYKDAIKTIAHWYDEGLVWSEAFSGDLAGFNTMLANDGVTSLAGIVPRKYITDAFKDQYVQLAPISADVRLKAYEITQTLRRAGFRCDVDLNNKKFKKLMNYADKIKVPKMIIIGKNDLDENKITIKDMQSGQQEQISIDDIVDYLKGE